MKYCEKCGAALPDESAFCTSCGAAVNAQPQPQVTPQPQQTYVAPQQPAVDTGSFGWAVLGFFIPLVGLILFLVWKNEKPLSAKKAGIGAIVGVVAYIVFWIVYYLLLFPAIGSSYYYY